MKKIAIIGCGSMGSMLVRGFIRSGRVRPEELVLATRTPGRLEPVKREWSGINVAAGNANAAAWADLVFVCVKPSEVKGVLEEIRGVFTGGKHLVSIAGDVTLENMGRALPGKITRVIPSLTSEVGEGVSLVCHNGNVEQDDAEYLEGLFNSIGKVMVIAESDFEAAADLTSCAPGLFASLFQEFVSAGLRHSSLSPADANEMVVRTLHGTARLFLEMNMGFDEAITRVATKGGITEEGVKVLRAGLPDVYDELFVRTLCRHATRRGEIDKQFVK